MIFWEGQKTMAYVFFSTNINHMWLLISNFPFPRTTSHLQVEQFAFLITLITVISINTHVYSFEFWHGSHNSSSTSALVFFSRLFTPQPALKFNFSAINFVDVLATSSDFSPGSGLYFLCPWASAYPPNTARYWIFPAWRGGVIHAASCFRTDFAAFNAALKKHRVTSQNISFTSDTVIQYDRIHSVLGFYINCITAAYGSKLVRKFKMGIILLRDLDWSCRWPVHF